MEFLVVMASLSGIDARNGYVPGAIDIIQFNYASEFTCSPAGDSHNRT